MLRALKLGLLLSGSALAIGLLGVIICSRSTTDSPSVSNRLETRSQPVIPEVQLDRTAKKKNLISPPVIPPQEPTVRSNNVNANLDSASEILVALVDPNKNIRMDAIEQAKQLVDRSVVPQLRGIADQMADPQEKAALLATIDFINLPSLTEVLAAQRASRLARGLPADVPRALTNHSTGQPLVRQPTSDGTPNNP